MARLTDKEIDEFEHKLGFISVLIRDGYNEKRVSASDVIKEFRERIREHERKISSRRLSKKMSGESKSDSEASG